MKIWILTSSFGSGHFSVAKALEEEYTQQGHTVVVSDIVRLLYPKKADLIYTVFRRYICQSSQIYTLVNHFGRNTYRHPETHPALQKELERIRPDQIVTTWSGCGRKLGKLEVPVHVCITDVGVHAGWLYPYAASYAVATADVAEQLEHMGVPAEKIHVRGIPVKSAFRQLPDKTAAEQRQDKHLLIMGGGLGVIPWLDDLLRDLQQAPHVKITVITGKNRKLYQKLHRQYPAVQAVGFVDDVPRYLAEADFLVSKPGGVSLFESIYATTPCIAMCPAYQHELENAAFIEQQELGMVVWQEKSAGAQILELLADEPRCRRYQQNVTRKKHEIEHSRKQMEGRDCENVV